MNGEREAHVTPVVPPSDRGASLAAEGQPAKGTALQRLEASRSHIRMAMEAHVRELASQQKPPPGAPRSLGQRLLEQVGRLPIIRTALAIRSLRRG